MSDSDILLNAFDPILHFDQTLSLRRRGKNPSTGPTRKWSILDFCFVFVFTKDMLNCLVFEIVMQKMCVYVF